MESRNHPARHASRRAAILLLAAAAALAPARAHLVPLSDEELVRAARHVVVATVADRTARWNARHDLILTDYTLAVEDVLRGDARRELRVTVVGGALDGETQASCLTVQLEPGRRYLLFVNDPEQPGFSTFTGGRDGVFVEQRAVPAGTPGAPGAPTTVVGGGTAFAALRGAGGADGGAVAFRTFVQRLRAFVADVESRPAPATRVPAMHDPPLPAAAWEPARGASARGPGIEPAGGARPATIVRPGDEGPPPPAAPVLRDLDPSHGVQEGVRGAGDYTYSRSPARYIVWNELPPGFAPWSPWDQYMMSRWNAYGDIHRISGAPTGTWAWQNNRYDMTGWPSSQDMLNAFGRGWGANELAVCWSRWFGDGPIVESDISMNPAFGWTLDDVVGSNQDDSRWSYPQTVLHELGHSWGLAHPWETQDVWWDSVMNYAPKEFRFPWLTADDTTAIRSAYPGIGVHDGMLKMWTTWDAWMNNNPGYTATVPAPNDVQQMSWFGFNQAFTVENVGTDNLVDPQIEVYLTPNRLDWTGATYLQTLSYTATIGPYGIWTLNAGSLYVPYWMPPGDYAVALWLRDNTEPFTYNNGSWTEHGAPLHVTSYPWAIYPESYWQYQAVTLGRNGQYDFYFTSDGAQRVDVSTCPADGGSANFDTVLEVNDPNGALAGYSDDACGLQSRTSVDAAVPGTYHVALHGFAGASGNVTMTYRKRTFADEALYLQVLQEPALGWVILDLFYGAGPYDLERATAPDFSDAVRLATGTEDTHFIDAVQADGLTYFYRAR